MTVVQHEYLPAAGAQTHCACRRKSIWGIEGGGAASRRTASGKTRYDSGRTPQGFNP